MVKDCIYGEMIIQNMKVSLKRIHYKERPKSILHKNKVILEGLETVEGMDKGNMCMRMEMSLVDSGKTI
jgi:hypothetical protein